jgi:ABC-type antimicrobial peptide transport system permease subunit
MIKNYLKVAWRNLTGNRVYSFINIAGLSVGMAVAMLIGLWIWDEVSFDKGNPHYDKIAEVMQHVSTNGAIGTGSTVPFPMGEALRKEFGSDFKYITMASWNSSHILSIDEKKLLANGSFFEPSALEILDVKMLKGSKDGLRDPASILLSVSSAKACFGDGDPMGKLIRLDNKYNLRVTGVYEDLPYNSSFADVKFIAPWELYSDIRGMKKQADPWRCNCYLSYVQMADQADMKKVSAKIRDIKLDKVNKSDLTGKPQVFLHPMSKWHLYSEFKNGVIVGGRIQYVWLFGIIGIFVLLLACINFMNLSTARSEKRAKEVGIRKSVGSLRGQLIIQFFSESLLVVGFAWALSFLLVQLILPFFNQVADKKISILWSNPYFWFSGLCFALFTGLIAGSYPALYLSSFKPVKVLKGVFKVGRLASVPRKVLVVLQFSVSVLLIIGTIVVFRQIEYARNRPVGYSRDGLVMMSMQTSDIHRHFAVVRNELLKSGAIASIAEAGSPTTAVWSTNAGFDWKGKDPNQSVEFPNIEISYDYGKTVGWQFADGRDFSRDFLTDSVGFVLNETAVKFMGLKNPVGETIKWDGVPYKVIGVIRDMVVESPYEPVRPTLFHLSHDPGDVVLVKIDPRVGAVEAVKKMESVFKKYNPAQPFDYRFVDEVYAKKFGNEERIGKLAGFFAVLAIFISCMGLFGMASFMAEQRVKEIGVRKVLGATVFNLWGLLSKDFVRLVVLSLLIAIPAAWYFMHGWLQHYHYRAGIAWWIFVVTGLGAMAITLLTVSVQAIRAALRNPVKSLRSE